MSRAGPSRGAALPLVLLVLLLLGAAAFAASFAATLDSVAARSSLESAQARAQASGALAFAVAELVTLGGAEVTSLPSELGPWPELGADVTVSLRSLGNWSPTGAEAAEAREVIELVARAATGRGYAEATAKIVLQPELSVVWRYLR